MTDSENRALLAPRMTETEVNRLSLLALAHIGDGVYELLTRTALCLEGHAAVHELHRLTVAHVKAGAQAQAVARLLPLLTEQELAVFKRGRNAHVHGVPRGASVGDYHAATGLEALFGWLYLLGRSERLEELFAAIWKE